MKYGLTLLAVLAAGTIVNAQDTRTVLEPAIPAACITITAQLTSPISDETHLDTKRIQQAMDSCTPGQAAVLNADTNHNAFLTGPLDLRKGVTLVVSKGATLFASRNPRDYDLQPGVCGTITEKGHDGIIDGRGGEKMLGQNISWWDLAEQARLSIDGGDNGIRIKSNSSRGGLVHDVVYEDVCIRDTKNPLFMDTHYSFTGPKRDNIPVFENIALRNVQSEGAGKLTFDGFDAAHPLKMLFDNVIFGDQNK